MQPNRNTPILRPDISAPMPRGPVPQRPSYNGFQQSSPNNSTQHNRTQNVSNHYPRPHKKSSTTKKILVSFLILLLIGGAGYGGYYYAGYEEKKKNSQQSASDIKQTTASATNSALLDVSDSVSSELTKSVLRVGYPSDLGGKKKFVINLGLPSVVEGVGVRSENNNRGQEKFYTDKYNDELGRWEVGFPAYQQNISNQISVVAISKSWLALAQQGNHAFDDTNIPLDTPEQKQSYINKIKSEAANCTKVKDQGFVTKDKTLSVCFSIIPGATTYEPIMVMRGYGEIASQPVLLLGFVQLAENKVYDKAVGEKYLEDAKKGKLQPTTMELLEKFVNSISQTTIKVEDA